MQEVEQTANLSGAFIKLYDKLASVLMQKGFRVNSSAKSNSSAKIPAKISAKID